MRWKDLRRHLRYYLGALPFIALLSRFPLWAARPLARVVGTVAWVLARTSRQRAMENLRSVFAGEKSEGELCRICRGVFRNMALNVFELLVVYRWPAEKIRRVFPLEEELRAIEEYGSGGVVGLTAHFGSWEMLGLLYSAFFPGRLRPVAKRIYFDKFQELVERFRKRVGIEALYTDQPPRRMVEALQEGKLVAMLPDQNLKAVSGIFVKFFGKEAYTSTAPVHLALSTGSQMLSCYLVREGGRFKVLFHPLPLSVTGQRELDIQVNTERWTRTLEADIRAYPDQWVWFHRRWRRRPEDGPRTVGRRRQSRPAGAEPEADPPAPEPGAVPVAGPEGSRG
jgi:KDO2-lipid IV(A) lauroyltransferase